MSCQLYSKQQNEMFVYIFFYHGSSALLNYDWRAL